MAVVDALVEAGEYESRAAFIAAAIEKLVKELEDEAIDQAIVEGYKRMPQTEEELRWADASARMSVRAEPW